MCCSHTLQVQVIDTVHNVQQGTQGLVPALDSFCEQVMSANLGFPFVYFIFYLMEKLIGLVRIGYGSNK